MNTLAFIAWARSEQQRIGEDSMQRRDKMQALINQMNMELGEANGRLRLLDELIAAAETGRMLWEAQPHVSDLSHPAAGAVDPDQ